MLNFTVYNRTACRTLVPWRIHGVNPLDITFRGFYIPQSDPGRIRVDVETGAQQYIVVTSKERMDLVDSNLKAMDVIGLFGPHAKFLLLKI